MLLEGLQNSVNPETNERKWEMRLGLGKGKEAWYLGPCPAFVNVG